jgi:hypothetical protein
VDRKYPIISAERVVTKFGPTVLTSITDEADRTVKVFMPKRYGSEFSDVDIEDINTAKESLFLVYKGRCDKTKSFLCACCRVNQDQINGWSCSLET